MKKNTLSAILLSTICLVCITCRLSSDASAGADPAELLPENNEISGFTLSGELAKMSDSKSIYDAIDGNAELYIKYGFIEGVMQRFQNAGIEVEVRILNQGTKSNARKIYADFYPSSAEVIAQGVYEMVIDHSLATGYGMFYTRDNVFIEIYTNEKTSFALRMAQQFCYNINGKMSVTN